MNLKELLSPEFCFAGVKAESKEELLRYLSGKLEERGIVKDSFADNLVLRENEYPTGLPLERELNVAIPHTFSEHVNSPQILVATLAEPMDFGCMGDPDTQVTVGTVIVMALKEGHLEALRQLMLLIAGNEEMMDAVQKTDNGAEIHRLMVEALS